MFSKTWSFSSKGKLELGPMYRPISNFSSMASGTMLDGTSALFDGTQGIDEADEIEEDKAKDWFWDWSLVSNLGFLKNFLYPYRNIISNFIRIFI